MGANNIHVMPEAIMAGMGCCRRRRVVGRATNLCVIAEAIPARAVIGWAANLHAEGIMIMAGTGRRCCQARRGVRRRAGNLRAIVEAITRITATRTECRLNLRSEVIIAGAIA